MKYTKIARPQFLLVYALNVACVSTTPVPETALTSRPRATMDIPPPPIPVNGPRVWIGSEEYQVDGKSFPWSPQVISTTHQSIPSLFTHIRTLQSSNDQIDAPGDCVFAISAKVPFQAAASALWSAGEAGCLRIWTPFQRTWLVLRVPRRQTLPVPDKAIEVAAGRRQLALHVTHSMLKLDVFAVGVRPNNSAAEPLEVVMQQSAARDAAGVTTLADAFAESCKGISGSCPAGVWFTAGQEILWGDALNALGTILTIRAEEEDAPIKNITVRFEPAGNSSLEDHATPSTSPRLPPSVIQDVVRTAFPAWHVCYEQGLIRDATLHGRVEMAFVIGLDGRVMGTPTAITPPATQQDAPPQLTDAAVLSCLAQKFKSHLVFPMPHGGKITVHYPIMFSRGP